MDTVSIEQWTYYDDEDAVISAERKMVDYLAPVSGSDLDTVWGKSLYADCLITAYLSFGYFWIEDDTDPCDPSGHVEYYVEMEHRPQRHYTVIIGKETYQQIQSKQQLIDFVAERLVELTAQWGYDLTDDEAKQIATERVDKAEEMMDTWPYASLLGPNELWPGQAPEILGPVGVFE